MSDATLIIIKDIVTVVGVISTAFFAYRAKVKSDQNGVKADDAKVVTEHLVKTAESTHVLANSNLSAVKTELQVASAKLVEMEKMIAELHAQKQEARVDKAMAMTPAPKPEPQSDSSADTGPIEVHVVNPDPVPVAVIKDKK